MSYYYYNTFRNQKIVKSSFVFILMAQIMKLFTQSKTTLLLQFIQAITVNKNIMIYCNAELKSVSNRSTWFPSIGQKNSP